MQQNFWEQGNLMKVNFREHLNLFLGNKGKTPIFSREQGNMYPPWEALVFKRNFFFQFFFFQEITELKKYYTRFSFVKVDDKPVAFAAVIHLMSEERDSGTSFSKSLLMGIYVQAGGN